MAANNPSHVLTEICAQIGMLMEDASPIALTIGTLGEAEQAIAIRDIDDAITKMRTLIDQAINIRGGNT